MAWHPGTYERFRRERAAPFADLLALIAVRPGLRVLDLGCGTGELTAQLAAALPESQVLGIDASDTMLEQARRRARPGLRFERGDIAAAEGSWDLVFSHAALHWVDNQDRLIPHLASLVAPGGQLAVQIPSNHDHASQRILRATAGEEPFRTTLGGWTRNSPVLPIDVYAELLHRTGATDIVVLEKVYPHVLVDADAVADWLSGTTIVPYRERLPAELYGTFLEAYRQRVRQRWPERPVFFPFRRILFRARW